MSTLPILWRRAPLWRAAIAAATTCSVLGFIARPALHGGASSPVASPSMIPPIPTGSSYQSPMQPASTPTQVSIMHPVAPVAALPPKIAPSRTLEPDKLPPAKDETPKEFGVYRGEDKSRLRPSLPSQSNHRADNADSDRQRR